MAKTGHFEVLDRDFDQWQNPPIIVQCGKDN